MSNQYATNHNPVPSKDEIATAEAMAEKANRLKKRALCDVYIDSRIMTGDFYQKDGFVVCDLQELYGRSFKPFTPIQSALKLAPLMEGISSDTACEELVAHLYNCYEHNLLIATGGFSHDNKE